MADGNFTSYISPNTYPPPILLPQKIKDPPNYYCMMCHGNIIPPSWPVQEKIYFKLGKALKEVNTLYYGYKKEKSRKGSYFKLVLVKYCWQCRLNIQQ